MTLGWFIAFLVLLVIELTTVNLVSIWFAIGALASMLTSFFTNSFIIQLIVFIVVSFVVLLITKPLVKKLRHGKVVPTNSDRFIGETGIVTKKITDNEYGEVKIKGTYWTATSDEVIDVDTKVKVLKISGVKLIVKKEDK